MLTAPPRDAPVGELLATAEPCWSAAGGLDDLIGALLASRPPWMRDGLCAEHPEVTFFPAPGGDIQPAKLICARCLVKAECRSWAIDQAGELDGIWGGTSKAQRQQARRAVAPPGRQVSPEQLKERVSSFLASHPGEAFTASGVRNGSSGHVQSIARALASLAEAGYATVTIGGTTAGRDYPDAPFYRHEVLFVARVPVTRAEAATPAA